MPNENLSNLIISLQKEFKGFKGDLSGLRTEFKNFRNEFNSFRNETNENFDEVYSKLDNHTAAIMSLENTVGFYGDMYKMNKEKIDNHEKRISVLEAK